VEEGSSPTKVIWKQAHVEAKEFRKCYSGFKWDLENDNGQSKLFWVACLLFTK
jgi:hypothetical protein